MKLKLDENLDWRLAPLLIAEGLDVDSVRSEGLSGTSDEVLYEACVASGRALVTLDLDFSDPLRFPPGPTQGIIVIRPPRPVLPAIHATLLSIMPQIKVERLQGVLWIVEPGRLRVFDPQDRMDA